MSKNVNVKEIDYSYIEGLLRVLSGRVLTVIDASIPDERQNKATKDLVKKEFWTSINKVQEYYWNGDKGHSVNLEGKPSDPLN